MKVLLFSNDDTLIGFCQHVLAGLPATEAKLEIGTSAGAASDGGLCLWDFIPGETALPQQLDPASLRRHLFLVQRKDLAALHERVGTSGINVLLKPVTAATLRAFLADACQAQGPGEEYLAGSVTTLRVERDEMLQFLIQANLRLQEYDQERTNVLARSLHDVRAPLTAISGYCGLLLEEALGPITTEQRDVLGRMQHSATRLSRIANSMFELSLNPGRPANVSFERADLRDCVDQALHELAPSFDNKGIRITVDIEKQPDGLFFEPTQIEQTLVNLLDNACRFTPRNGTVEIRGYPFFWERRTAESPRLPAGRERRTVQLKPSNAMRIDIRDSGPGIPEAHVGTIFEEYTSYLGGSDRSGGGLGLAICRLILQRHGGKVWAESHGAGAVFSFVLPIRAEGTSVGETQPAKDLVAGFRES